MKGNVSNNNNVPKDSWCGGDDARIPLEQRTQENGLGEFYAPPRGYAVYVPRE